MGAHPCLSTTWGQNRNWWGLVQQHWIVDEEEFDVDDEEFDHHEESSCSEYESDARNQYDFTIVQDMGNIITHKNREDLTIEKNAGYTTNQEFTEQLIFTQYYDRRGKSHDIDDDFMATER